MGAGGSANGSRLVSNIAGGWPRQTGPRLAIPSGGPRGSSAEDQSDLEPSRYKFMALWTLYELVWCSQETTWVRLLQPLVQAVRGCRALSAYGSFGRISSST